MYRRFLRMAAVLCLCLSIGGCSLFDTSDKKISDMDYHGEEKVDHLYYDGTLPLESLAEEVIAVPSAEEGYITEIDLSERHLLENLLLEVGWRCLPWTVISKHMISQFL